MDNVEWEYRICIHDNKYTQSYYQIHRVFYNDDGSIKKISEIAHEPYGLSLNDLMHDLGQMMWADKKPIIDYNTKKEVEFIK